MKYSKTTVDRSEITLKGCFPHRSLRKELPKICEKPVPVHNLQINQIYQGKVVQMLLPEQWAYIPIKAHKKSHINRSHTEGTEHISQKSLTKSSNHFRSTSEIFLKKYLKRKQMKQAREMGNMTNYVGLSEQKKQHSQSNYLQGIIKMKDSRLERYRSETRPEKEKHSTIQSPKSFLRDEINEFKSEKVRLKEKLKVYETNVKTKRFQIKIGDKRYKKILHTFEDNQ